MSVLGNAAKWALLAPVVCVAIAVYIFACLGFGHGIASLFTDDPTIKWGAALLTMTMGLGAWMGAANAQ